MTKRIMVTTTLTALHRAESARQIAAQLNLPYHDITDAHEPLFDYLLVLTEKAIGIKKRDSKNLFCIDFAAGHLQYRRQHATNRNELLARAIGIKPHQQPSLVDATAGLGRDSFILASLGYSITLLERNPIIHLLLQDALVNARSSPQLLPIMDRITLIHADATEWLAKKRFDVVYMDPMFPQRQKTALVKKPNLILQELLTCDVKLDSTLLEIALTCAAKRVVIKRPRLADCIAGKTPSFSMAGCSCRFDVYMVN